MSFQKLFGIVTLVLVLVWIAFAALPGPVFDRYHHVTGAPSPGGFDPVPVFDRTRDEESFRGASCSAQAAWSHQLHRACTL